MIIELKEKEVSSSKVYSPESYDEDGLYLVYDKVSWCIVSSIDGLITSVPLQSKKVIEQYRKQAKDECRKDFEADIESLLNQIKDLIIESKSSNSTGADIDISELTRLVAVAQKPELIKG